MEKARLHLNLDELFENNRRGVLALAVFFSCTMNYYFFVGQVVFVVIYWLVRVITKSYRINLRNMLSLIAEAFLGVGCSAIILIPSILCVMQNGRISNTINGWEALAYGSSQRYTNIVTAFLFPPELPAYPTFTPDSNTKWG